MFWNDRYGDGKIRWKTGGIIQGYVFPEHIFRDENWFQGRASALELNLRALVMTPDGTSFSGVDRPYAQYASAGIYLRSITRPEALTAAVAIGAEGRVHPRASFFAPLLARRDGDRLAPRGSGGEFWPWHTR